MSMLGRKQLETESATARRVHLGVYLTLSALSVLLNGTFLIVIWKSWTVLKQRRITYHVTNLAISDFTVGASTFCHYISIVAADGEETAVTSVFSTIAWTATLTSLLAVCLMAIERGICIMKPLTWSPILPLRRILKVMVANYVLALPLAILMRFYELPMKFTLLVLFNIPIFVTTVVYTAIYIKLCKVTPKEEHGDDTQQNPSAAIEERRNKMMQRKVGGLVLILTLVLLTTVSPSFLVVTIKISCELFESKCKFKRTVTTLTHYFYMLELTNFVVNPIFYVWRMSMYRQAFCKLFGRTSCEN